MITVLHKGGPTNDYGITYGVVWQMITVYNESLGYYIRNIISIDLTKNQIF